MNVFCFSKANKKAPSKGIMTYLTVFHSAKTGDLHEENGRNVKSNKTESNNNRDECETCADSESACSGDHLPPLRNFHNYKQGKCFQ